MNGPDSPSSGGYNLYGGYMEKARNAYYRRLISRHSAPSDTILDVGCGQGDFLVQCAEAGRSVASGVDIEQRWVDYSRGRGCRAECYDGSRLPAGDGSVDLVFSHSVLEHVQPLPFMREINRVLRPGGRCVITTCTPEDAFWNDPTHIRPYTLRAMRTLFEMTGFETVHRNHVLGELLGVNLGWNGFYKLINLIPASVGGNLIAVGRKVS